MYAPQTLVILVVLGLHYCTRAFPSCSNQGLLFSRGCLRLLQTASLVSGQVLDTWASVVVGRGL